jgi:hypothetical protein
MHLSGSPFLLASGVEFPNAEEGEHVSDMDAGSGHTREAVIHSPGGFISMDRHVGRLHGAELAGRAP